jgi:hypothetical protein
VSIPVVRAASSTGIARMTASMQLVSGQLKPVSCCPGCLSFTQTSAAVPKLSGLLFAKHHSERWSLTSKPTSTNQISKLPGAQLSASQRSFIGKKLVAKTYNATSARGGRKGAARAVASDGESKQVYQGMYGPWTVDETDEREVSQ